MWCSWINSFCEWFLIIFNKRSAKPLFIIGSNCEPEKYSFRLVRWYHNQLCKFLVCYCCRLLLLWSPLSNITSRHVWIAVACCACRSFPLMTVTGFFVVVVLCTFWFIYIFFFLIVVCCCSFMCMFGGLTWYCNVFEKTNSLLWSGSFGICCHYAIQNLKTSLVDNSQTRTVIFWKITNKQ